MESSAITIPEAGRRTGWGPWVVRQAVLSGELRAARPGGRYLIAPEDLKAWAARQVVQPHGEAPHRAA